MLPNKYVVYRGFYTYTGTDIQAVLFEYEFKYE